MTAITQDDIEYPRDVFYELIHGNSPYAFYLFQWVPYQTEAKKWRLKMLHDVKPFAQLVVNTSGRIPIERLSFADWHRLTKAAKIRGYEE